MQCPREGDQNGMSARDVSQATVQSPGMTYITLNASCWQDNRINATGTAFDVCPCKFLRMSCFLPYINTPEIFST